MDTRATHTATGVSRGCGKIQHGHSYGVARVSHDTVRAVSHGDNKSAKNGYKVFF